MSVSIDETLLNSIVAGVLARLNEQVAPTPSPESGPRNSGTSSNQQSKSKEKDSGHATKFLNSRVVTEAILAEHLNGATSVRFAPKAVLTPSARDYLRVHSIDWSYASRQSAKGAKNEQGWAALIVKATPEVERVVADELVGARTELLSCPDDAAKLAIAELSRGGFQQAIIFSEQRHRAACLANRHSSVKAVAVHDANDVKAVRQQLRVNVWCVDPSGRSRFELANLIKTIVRGSPC